MQLDCVNEDTFLGGKKWMGLGYGISLLNPPHVIPLLSVQIK